jgi:hypothetical protein
LDNEVLEFLLSAGFGPEYSYYFAFTKKKKIVNTSGTTELVGTMVMLLNCVWEVHSSNLGGKPLTLTSFCSFSLSIKANTGIAL